MHALIIANGTLPAPKRLQPEIEHAALVLCADGGANRATAAGIQPHFIVGDLDSITSETRAFLAPEILIHRSSQYATDLEKTIQFAIENEVTSATIVGVTGGRLDHQICNLNILEKFSDRLEISCVDDTGIGNFVRDRIVFQARIGQQVSIFAFRRAEGIATRGLKYPISDGRMEWAVNDGLSNEVIASPVEIRVQRGVLFVFRVWPR